MIAGRSPWLCQGTTPPGWMTSLRSRSSRSAIFAGSSASLIAASTVSVTPLAGVVPILVRSVPRLSAGHSPALAGPSNVNIAPATRPAARRLRRIDRLPMVGLLISLSPCCSSAGSKDLGNGTLQLRGRRGRTEIPDGFQVHSGWLFASAAELSVPGIRPLVCGLPLGFLAPCEGRLPEPLRSHRLAHERADSRRMRPPPDGDQAHFAPEFRLDQRPGNHPVVIDGIFGHQPESQPRRDHREDPIVAVAPIHHLAGRAASGEYRACVQFAVAAVQIALAIEILDANRVAGGERVTRSEEHTS